MSDDNLKNFEARIKGIEKTYRKGGRHNTGSNPKESRRIARKGTKPARAKRSSPITFRRLIKASVWMFVIFLALRIFASYQLGTAVYDGKVDALAEGGSVTKIAASAFARGPIMQPIEQFVRRIIASSEVASQPSGDPEG